MYKIIYRSTREDLTLTFLPKPQPFTDLIDLEKSQGRLLEVSSTLVDNNYTERYLLLWDSLSSLSQFNKNPIVIDFLKNLFEYNRRNKIYTNIIGEEYDE
jgi:hypothetical protein